MVIQTANLSALKNLGGNQYLWKLNALIIRTILIMINITRCPKDMFPKLPAKYLHSIRRNVFLLQKVISVILKFLSEHEFTWELQCQILMDFYDHVISTKPTKFHNRRNELKEQVKLYAQFECDVIAELPLVLGCEIVRNERDGESPFRKRKNFTHSVIDLTLLVDKGNVLAAESKCVIKDAHNICQDKASEI